MSEKDASKTEKLKSELTEEEAKIKEEKRQKKLADRRRKRREKAEQAKRAAETVLRVELSENENFEVEKITDEKLVNGKWLYRVRWKGFSHK